MQQFKIVCLTHVPSSLHLIYIYSSSQNDQNSHPWWKQRAYESKCRESDSIFGPRISNPFSWAYTGCSVRVIHSSAPAASHWRLISLHKPVLVCGGPRGFRHCSEISQPKPLQLYQSRYSDLLPCRVYAAVDDGIAEMSALDHSGVLGEHRWEVYGCGEVGPQVFRWSKLAHDREDLGGPVGLCSIDLLLSLDD